MTVPGIPGLRGLGVRNTTLSRRKNKKQPAASLRHRAPAAAAALAGGFLAAALIIAQTGCALAGGGINSEEQEAACEPVTKESFYFDTICQITIYGIGQNAASNAESPKEAAESSADAASDGKSPGTGQQGESEAELFSEKAESMIDDAFSLCSDYEKLLSKTKEGSDIWNLNHAGGEPVACDPRTIEVLEKGISYGELSEGKFDITVGKAEDLWNFHEETPKVPAETMLKEAVSHVDYRKIRVDKKTGTAELTDPEAEIDLGGIAKGYIADAVCTQLREEGVSSAIVSLGGNIESIGGKPDSVGFTTEQTVFSPFSIGIETPYSDRTEIVGSSPLTEGTMVTSGVYERFFTENGREYHHILDTETGYPVDSDVLGVTIKGDEGTSADCDALSTLCLILGSEKGMQLMEKMNGYEALFLLRDGTEKKTEGMTFTPAK